MPASQRCLHGNTALLVHAAEQISKLLRIWRHPCQLQQLGPAIAANLVDLMVRTDHVVDATRVQDVGTGVELGSMLFDKPLGLNLQHHPPIAVAQLHEVVGDMVALLVAIGVGNPRRLMLYPADLGGQQQHPDDRRFQI